MPDHDILIIVVATFLLAGFVKGVVGLGLPTVSLGILTAAIDLPTAMALLIAPSFVTNLWQGAVGGNARLILQREWRFVLLATLAIPLGAITVSHVEAKWLSALLGLLVLAYGAIGLAGIRLSKPDGPIAGAAFGLVNGVLTGMTGSFVVPGVMYLQSLGLPRDTLVQAMGILFTLSTLGLAATLAASDRLTIDLGLLSALAVMPSIAGMVIGQSARRRLSEHLFRMVFFAALAGLGSYIAVSALWGGSP